MESYLESIALKDRAFRGALVHQGEEAWMDGVGAFREGSRRSRGNQRQDFHHDLLARRTFVLGLSEQFWRSVVHELNADRARFESRQICLRRSVSSQGVERFHSHSSSSNMEVLQRMSQAFQRASLMSSSTASAKQFL